MSSELMLDVGLANELKMAFRRAGATSQEVKQLSEGNFMKGVIHLLREDYAAASRIFSRCSTANLEFEWLLKNVVGKVFVDESLSLAQAIAELDRENQDGLWAESALCSVRRSRTGGETELIFVQLSFYANPDFLRDKHLKKEGLVPADPFAVLAYNAAHPEFADKYPHGTQWQDEKGVFCKVRFGTTDGRRWVSWQHHFDFWHEGTWIACQRLPASN